jgi:hypothetical protein
MAVNTAAADEDRAKIICFRCRRSACGCLEPVPRLRPRNEVAWAIAWLGGACAAGTALGAALALLLGG